MTLYSISNKSRLKAIGGKYNATGVEKMAVDLRQHKAILSTVFLAGARTISRCLDRMEMGKEVYEAPGYVDRRDYVHEAEDEMMDALNYLAMEYAECYQENARRAALVAAIGNAIWQAHVGIENLLGVDEDDT